MGLDNFTIVLNKVGEEYLPGQEVSGTVHITNSSSKLLKGMYVECQGFGKFYYDELRNETHVTTEKCYLNLKNPLINIQDDSYELTKGEYQFPFAFTLPENIPSTFQAETHSKFDYGHVSYTIKAVLERFSRRRSTCENQCHNPLANALKTQKSNYECSVTLMVKNLVDLNTIPVASIPVESLKSQIGFSFCCFPTGSITVRTFLDKSGYVPGETIQLHTEVDNQSRMAFGSFANLVETVEFHFHEKTKAYERIVVQQQGKEAKDPSQVIPIQIPYDLSPSYLLHCDIIDISYKIEYTLFDVKSPNSRIGPFYLNIILGNVPLRSKDPQEK